MNYCFKGCSTCCQSCCKCVSKSCKECGKCCDEICGCCNKCCGNVCEGCTSCCEQIQQCFSLPFSFCTFVSVFVLGVPFVLMLTVVGSPPVCKQPIFTVLLIESIGNLLNLCFCFYLLCAFRQGYQHRVDLVTREKIEENNVFDKVKNLILYDCVVFMYLLISIGLFCFSWAGTAWLAGEKQCNNTNMFTMAEVNLIAMFVFQGIGTFSFLFIIFLKAYEEGSCNFCDFCVCLFLCMTCGLCDMRGKKRDKQFYEQRRQKRQQHYQKQRQQQEVRRQQGKQPSLLARANNFLNVFWATNNNNNNNNRQQQMAQPIMPQQQQQQINMYNQPQQQQQQQIMQQQQMQIQQQQNQIQMMQQQNQAQQQIIYQQQQLQQGQGYPVLNDPQNEQVAQGQQYIPVQNVNLNKEEVKKKNIIGDIKDKVKDVFSKDKKK